EYAKGYLKRRDLLKYAGLIGLTGFAASQGLGFSRARAAAAGGTVHVGLGQPTKAIDPVTVTDPASIGVLSQVGEYLILD
ncbi:MAG: peptide ABC transporter substrate-binding protein, partial [Mesorhizobium sp.]